MKVYGQDREDRAADTGALPSEELAQFRAWFLDYDWAIWDRQIEGDAAAGRLDDLAARARRDHAAGKSTPI